MLLKFQVPHQHLIKFFSSSSSSSVFASSFSTSSTSASTASTSASSLSFSPSSKPFTPKIIRQIDYPTFYWDKEQTYYELFQPKKVLPKFPILKLRPVSFSGKIDLGLLPFISAKTLEYHHDTIYRNLLIAVDHLIKDNRKYQNKSLVKLVRMTHKYEDPTHHHIFSDCFNHSFFFNCLKPLDPSSPLQPIPDVCGPFTAALVGQMLGAGRAFFGSGWLWAISKQGVCQVIPKINSDSPLIDKDPTLRLLFALDCWEHSYFYDYDFITRPNYADRFINQINWEFVAYAAKTPVEELDIVSPRIPYPSKF